MNVRDHKADRWRILFIVYYCWVMNFI